MIPVISFEHHTSCMRPSGMSRKFIPSSMNFCKFSKTIYDNNMILRLL